MFGAVVATAMGVLFLYVVPSLRDDLVSDRLDRLVQVAHAQQKAPGLQRAMETGKHMRRPLVRTQRLANATVTGYRLTADGLEPLEFAPPILSRRSPLAKAALKDGVARGRTPSGGVVVAFTVSGGLLFLSQGLSDVNAAAALVERQILIATLIAARRRGRRRLGRGACDLGAARAARGGGEPHRRRHVRPADRRHLARRTGPGGAVVRPHADAARAGRPGAEGLHRERLA